MSSQSITIHTSYDIAEAPWWRIGIDKPESVESLEKRISHLHETLNNAIKSTPQECKEYTEFQHQKYALECIIGECNVQMTYEDVEKYLAFGDEELQHLKKSNVKHYRTVIKTRNVYRVVKKLFPSAFSFKSCCSMQEFNLEFIQAIHREIGNGILDDCGQFRQTLAAPAHEDLYEYVKPELIQEELEKLVEECKLVFSKPQGLLDAVKCGACFLYRFLDIHPFSNGNGRTARVLLSWLLQNFTIVPLPLYTALKKRKIYLDCLREARYDKADKPSHLARFILESVQKEFVDCCFLMEISV